ncbi:hypothetical protein AC477_00055 [miscellaneous Crenarchaeota group-1 archaeon SG8-32-1]|uniref:Restriction alleviation protein, Lar family n=1 Tax=miscellaneous Crenarchaeota group-1 archaeon SG8-32-1 TaxID=1685124 RepID=A0A0M0C1F2_9ARCH|nr:MAG: hypothetical protein AC477_00055 [miscellaneous Crenarchaeota group-1 archaeon SG8-32-1]
MTKTTEKSCPFCGSENVNTIPLSKLRSDDSQLYQTFCLDCKAGGPRSLERDVAIARWNTTVLTRDVNDHSDQT